MTTIAPAQRTVIRLILDKTPQEQFHEVFSGLVDYIGEKNYNTLLKQITLHDVVDLRG